MTLITEISVNFGEQIKFVGELKIPFAFSIEGIKKC
jgi:hypothetical protein